jgi:DNA polymerase bacteriophage-type
LTWWEDEPRMTRMGTYCHADVAAECALDRFLPELTAFERQIWLLTETINDRGIMVDQPMLRRVVDLAGEALAGLNAQIKAATAGAVPSVTNCGALKRWLDARGVKTDAVDKYAIADLLEGELDDGIRDVLEMRRDGGGSSHTKAPSIERRLSGDGRLRGSLIYGGAPATLRWSSVGAQLQNIRRHDDRFVVDYLVRDVCNGASLTELECLHGPPLLLCSELLRPVFVAETDALIIADFSQIEARVLAWFAGQQDRLQIFRENDAGIGPDPYKITAARVYQVPIVEITKDQRFIGKTADLALGYQGGQSAIRKLARAFGVKITTEKAEAVKLAWRAAHPYIVQFWHDLEAAAFEIVRRAEPGLTLHVGKISLTRDKRRLYIRLPSGRRLVYWDVEIKDAKKPWGDVLPSVTYWAENNLTHQWAEFAAYGGLYAENIVQGTARDLLADAMLRVDAAGMRPILSVHDEVVLETSHAEASVMEIMTTPPPWAADLPLAAKLVHGLRYMKD